MSWMVDGWNKDLDAAYEAACRLGTAIAVEKKWPDQWVRLWGETATEVYDQVLADRGVLGTVGAAVGIGGENEAERFWRGIAGAVLLDADPKSGLGAPPDGYGDLYMVALQACGAVQSAKEAQEAAGMWAHLSGAATLTATDLKAVGVAGGQAVQSVAGASSGLAKVAGLGLALYFAAKVL